MDVNDDNLKKYFDYLNDHLDFSDLVTGMEDFRWKEYYVFGPGDQKEYEKLKKKNPSYTDHYQILSLEEYDYDESILVNVKRISDNKKFAGQTVLIGGIQTGVWVVKPGRFFFLVSPATGQKKGRSDRKRNLSVVSQEVL